MNTRKGKLQEVLESQKEEYSRSRAKLVFERSSLIRKIIMLDLNYQPLFNVDVYN